MSRWIALCSVAFLLGGCFVLDEIDAGQELMKQHQPKDAATAEPEEKSSEDDSPGFLERAKRFWAGLGGDGQRGEGAHADDSPPPHPDNVLVRCDVQGRLEFTRKFTCHRKGGKVLGPMHTSKR
jgi:hypothetical protein